MASLKEVKKRITSVVSTQQITKAMKMVSASKLRRAQDAIIQMRPYAGKLSEILQNVSGGGDVSNVYAEEREVKRVLIIAIASDKGLCGAFNSNVFKAANTLIEKKYATEQKAGNVHILTIGKRSAEYYKKKGFTVTGKFTDLFTRLSFEHVREAAEYAMEAFVEKEYDRVELVYNEFKNIATQILRAEQLLPMTSVVPEDADPRDTDADYIFEPNKNFIIEELIPKSIKLQVFKAVLESNASEHGARMMAMDKATENAGEILKDLRLTYNRTRQAAITKEILEIVGGAEALSAG